MDADQSFLDTLGFGYTQTQPESPIGEQATPSTQHQATPSTQQRSAIIEKGKSNKGKNWSSDEDKVLIAAWAKTSLDIVGTDQNRDAYCARISEYYNTHKESSWPERNPNAINCRYTLINRETSKFCGCLQQILNKEESGRTIAEKQSKRRMRSKKRQEMLAMHSNLNCEKRRLHSERRRMHENEREDARRQFELDERVMLIDTSGMTDVQKQFYQAKQNEILARGLE
uniref:No apical meristem-associated C-terminal domain-containing protein n=1 Tax=Aegilops tauschii TaxID=37682 RepID=M8BMJ9_AEGTA